jgi:oligopeptide/dipeptide ABC transporter ATP-binding protein
VNTLSRTEILAASAANATPLVELRGVSRRFEKRVDLVERVAAKLGVHTVPKAVQAVEAVDLSIAEGEVVGVVGESGCGKSTLGRIVAGILPPTTGRTLYRGQDVRQLSEPAAKQAKLKVQMIFQDPFASLNPRMRVRDIIGEAPRVHGLVKRGDLDAYLDQIMLRCGLDPAFKARYPHQFSGGQRQRIGIARALAVQPELIVSDEAVAALDVSIQAQILNLFIELKNSFDLTYLFISHDLSVVEHVSDRVVIMYLGRIVERASTEELFVRPNHPYTQALLAQSPRLHQRGTRFIPIHGEIPSPFAPPPGCHFHSRCPKAFERCKQEVPQLREIVPGHFSACHLND